MHLDFTNLSPNQVYHTMIQTVIPRPIAWVLSENDSGNFNVAPFSYFTAVASDPALLMFSVGKKADDDSKDTLKNIQARKEFVIHIAQAELVSELNQSAAPLPYGESEVENIGLSTQTIEHFNLPRISQAKIAFACTLFDIQEIGNKPMSLVFGEIQSAYICDSIITNDGKRTHVNANALNPLARLGGNDYTAIHPAFTVERPT
ncbi:MAG: flavin reductase family protein [Arenicella sp.]